MMQYLFEEALHLLEDKLKKGLCGISQTEALIRALIPYLIILYTVFWYKKMEKYLSEEHLQASMA